jgi:hypothetical protein
MKPYSMDLRALFCRYLDEGMSSRAAGRVVGVSASTAVKWAQRRRATGSVAAQKVGGGKPVLLEAERGWLVARIEQVKDLTLHELLGTSCWRSCVTSGAWWCAATRCGGFSSAAARHLKKDDLRKRAGSA